MSCDNGLVLKRNKEQRSSLHFLLQPLPSPPLFFLLLLSFSSLQNLSPTVILSSFSLSCPHFTIWSSLRYTSSACRVCVPSVWSVYRPDKPGWCSSCAVAWGWRQWHQFAPRTTCPSVTINDKAHLFWSLWTNKPWKDYHAHHWQHTVHLTKSNKELILS